MKKHENPLQWDIPLKRICFVPQVSLTHFAHTTLKDRYLLPGETPKDLFQRVAQAYGDDAAHTNRLLTYMLQQWFMPATPILANGGTHRGYPISCFLTEIEDSLSGLVHNWNQHIGLASKGGGIGTYVGHIRSLGEKVGGNGETAGIMPFAKVIDSMTLAISQGSLRRGSAALYLPMDHPEIEEFIEMRRPTGGDQNRRCLNLHHGVVIPHAFMQAVDAGTAWELKSPHTQEVLRTVSARELWIRLLETRVSTGEPYLLFIDAVNDAIPGFHRDQGLYVKTSNLCSEITLPTGMDPWGRERIAVCCLSSLNLDHYLAWKDDPWFIEDVLRFLDNVLQSYIDRVGIEPSKDVLAPHNAAYSAHRERSIGLGVMGFHSFLQSQNIPLETVTAQSWNKTIFSHIRQEADRVSQKLAQERGPCPDAAAAGVQERWANKMAIAPTASISILCGSTSPGIEPFVANAFVQKTLSGSFTVYNQNLARLLESKGLNAEKILEDVAQNNGSVAHLSCLSDYEKSVFRTAFEMDQRWLVDLAAERQPYICQAQSLNLFFPSNVHKADLHEVHHRAWRKHLKSCYYLRSQSAQQAENDVVAQSQNTLPLEYSECLSCQ